MTAGLRVVVTGGAGFVGRRLIEALAARGTLRGAPIAGVLMLDTTKAGGFRAPFTVTSVAVDVADREALDAAMAIRPDVVFHLAAVQSRAAEADFVAGMKTNFFGAFNMVESLRALGTAPVLVAASMRGAAAPRGSAAAHKAIMETLIADYSRRGFLDGRSLRLPTIAPRPGAADASASGYVSDLIRLPSLGEPVACEAEPDAPVSLIGADGAVAALIAAAEEDGNALGPDRTHVAPALETTPAGIVAALSNVLGEDAAELVDWVGEAPAQTPPSDADVEALIRAYLAQEGIEAAS